MLLAGMRAVLALSPALGHKGAGSQLLRRTALSMSTKGMSELEELKFLLGDRSIGSLHDFGATNAAGETVPMSTFQGKAVLVVNVASL